MCSAWWQLEQLQANQISTLGLSEAGLPACCHLTLGFFYCVSSEEVIHTDIHTDTHTRPQIYLNMQVYSKLHTHTHTDTYRKHTYIYLYLHTCKFQTAVFPFVYPLCVHVHVSTNRHLFYFFSFFNLFFILYFFEDLLVFSFISVMLFFLSHGITVRELPNNKSTGPSTPVVCPPANHWANIL